MTESRAGSLPAALDPSALALRLPRPFSADRIEDDHIAEARAPLVGGHLAAVVELVPRGATVDHCRFRMRDVEQIGAGASPDGRPGSCRLISFVRRQRWRDAQGARRPRLTLRFRLDDLLAQRVVRQPGTAVFRPSAPPAGPAAPRMHYAPANANFGFLYAAQGQQRPMINAARPPMEPMRPRAARSSDGR